MAPGVGDRLPAKIVRNPTLFIVGRRIQATEEGRHDVRIFRRADHDDQRRNHGSENVQRNARPAEHPEGPHDGQHRCDDGQHGGEARTHEEQDCCDEDEGGKRTEQQEVPTQTTAELFVDSRRTDLEHHVELIGVSLERVLDAEIDRARESRPILTIEHRHDDGSHLAVIGEEIAEIERIVERALLGNERLLQRLGRPLQNGLGGHATTFALNHPEIEDAVHPQHFRDRSEFRLQALERVQLPRRPERLVAHVDDGLVIRAELFHHSLVDESIRIVVRNQRVETRVQRKARETASKSGSRQQQEASHPESMTNAEKEEARDHGARSTRTSSGSTISCRPSPWSPSGARSSGGGRFATSQSSANISSGT